MATMDLLSAGRAAYDERRWRDAYERLASADVAHPLDPDDLERFANAARLLGHDATLGPVWMRAHQGFVERGDLRGATRCAFRIALVHVLRGEHAQGSGWISRAARMLDGAGEPCVEHGYLTFARGLAAALSGDVASARARFAESIATGTRFGDRSLIAFARHGEGRTLVAMGETRAGAALFDEVMAAISAGEVSPMVVGDIYCSVIQACREMLDVRRAQEWTKALDEWSATQPDMLTYRGQCLVHRSEVLALRGDWSSAADEAERARACLADPPPPHRAIGAAFYQIGELHRLRGAFDLAEDAYREASRAGRDPQPGLALLRLARGHIDSARNTLARAMDDPAQRGRRAEILFACVEVALVAGDADGAHAAAEALARLATPASAPFLRAMAAHARGAVSLDAGDGRGALEALRRASSWWEEVGAPFEAARTRALIGLACRLLGDEDSAALELDAARCALDALGARPDALRVEALVAPNRRSRSGQLTERELEVIRLIASGRTNKAIAAALGLSDKTVARHVANIFTKLDLSSRAAATAYAYERGLVTPRST